MGSLSVSHQLSSARLATKRFRSKQNHIMNKLLLLTFFILLSCKSDKKPHEKTFAVTTSKLKHKISPINIKNPSVIVVEFDDVQLDRLKKINEEDFYTAADDVMWYDAQLKQKMDSLRIPIVRSKKDTIELHMPTSKFVIIKDTAQGIYTYYFYDGKKVSQRDVFDLLDK